MEPALPKPAFPKAVLTYIAAIAVTGTVVVGFSTHDLLAQFQRVPEYGEHWLALVVLTVISGLLPVSIRSLNVTISISETFVIAGTLLFGRSGGTVLGLLDALFLSIYLLFVTKRIRWQQAVFNLGLTPVSVWAAATIAHIEPRFKAVDAPFVLQLAIFTTVDCLVNTWLLAFVVALQQKARAAQIWRSLFRDLLVNYAAGGSIAALLVYNSREIKLEVLLAILPLLIVLFLTYQWSNNRLEAEKERNSELNRVFLSTIEALALAIDAKDQVTHGHIRRVQRYTMALAEALGVNDNRQLDALRAAALLHDTGKLAVPEYILNKPGPLTPAEFERMKVHADVGADILKSIDFPYPVEPIVRHHHENWNGTGYPAGLAGQQIPLGARILSVVDCYDALTSDRPYRPRYSKEHAIQVLKERRDTWYDPWVVDRFLQIIDLLERDDEQKSSMSVSSAVSPKGVHSQLEVIAATTAEEREFNELRRDLPLATDAGTAAELLFRHIRRVTPSATLALLVPAQEIGDLSVIAAAGVGRAALEGLHVPVGGRISGWAFAHRQPVVNSNAALEIGPVARTFSTPLRYGMAVPVIAGAQATAVAVVTCYGSEPFSTDHKRILESAATLFGASVTAAVLAVRPTPTEQLRSSTVH